MIQKQWSPSSQQLEERGPMGGLQAWVHKRGRSKSVQRSWWTQPRIPCFEIFVLLKLGLFSWSHHFLLPHHLTHQKNAQGTATNREGDSIACFRRSDSGVRREGRKREKNKEEKRERERGGNNCEICFQKVIPPTLSASNPNVVSSFKSCQSSNGQQSALLTEF